MQKGYSAANFSLALTDLISVGQNQKCILELLIRNTSIYPQLRHNILCINVVSESKV